MKRRIPAVASIVIIGACGSRDQVIPRADSATVAAMRAESIVASHTAALAPTGHWDVDHVSERLVRAGVAPRRVEDSSAVPPFLSSAVENASFDVGRAAHLRVFIFADSMARRKVTETLDPVTASPKGEPMAWQEAPLLIVVQNLMGVMTGGTARQQERVELALEAGLGS